jgi:hypothetical protein
MADQQAQAAPSQAAPSTTDGGTPQIDVENVTMEQLDNLFERGSAELPVKSEGGEKAQEPAKKEDPPPAKAKAEDPPPKKEEPVTPAGDEPPATTGEEEEVVESRTTDEIEAAVTEAVQKVIDDGGDQAAQDEAAEAARQPVAKVEAAPAPAAAKKEEPEEKSRRFRVKDPIAQAALELYKTFENTDTPITLAEAERRVRGDAAPEKKEPAKAAAVEPNLQEVVTTLDAKVTDLKSKLEAAGGDEALFTKEIAQWQIELSDAQSDLKLARRDLKEAQELAQLEAEETDQAFKTAVDKSRAKATELYPDVADENTALGKAVAERIVAMRSKSHPDHNILFTGSAPEVITRTVADELGIAAKTKKAAAPPPKPKPATPPAAKKVTPVSGARSAAASAPTPEDASKKTVEYLKSDEASLADLDKAFGADKPLQLIGV